MPFGLHVRAVKMEVRRIQLLREGGGWQGIDAVRREIVAQADSQGLARWTRSVGTGTDPLIVIARRACGSHRCPCTRRRSPERRAQGAVGPPGEPRARPAAGPSPPRPATSSTPSSGMWACAPAACARANARRECGGAECAGRRSARRAVRVQPQASGQCRRVPADVPLPPTPVPHPGRLSHPADVSPVQEAVWHCRNTNGRQQSISDPGSGARAARARPRVSRSRPR